MIPPKLKGRGVHSSSASTYRNGTRSHCRAPGRARWLKQLSPWRGHPGEGMHVGLGRGAVALDALMR